MGTVLVVLLVPLVCGTFSALAQEPDETYPESPADTLTAEVDTTAVEQVFKDFKALQAA